MTRHALRLILCAPLLVLVFAAPAMAQSSADDLKNLDDQAQKFISADTLTSYNSKLTPIVSELAPREALLRAASRFAHFYLSYARAAKTDVDFKTLEVLYPRFKAASDAILQAGSLTARGLVSGGIDRDIVYIDGQVAKLLAEPKLRAAFLTWEADVVGPYGMTPVRLAVLIDSNNKFPQAALGNVAEAPGKVKDWLEKVTPRDIGKYAEAFSDIFGGVGVIVGDVMTVRTAPWRSFLSVPGGLKQFGEGWNKLFS